MINRWIKVRRSRMRETERIAEEMGRMYEGDAWYGPQLKGLLADVTAAEAAARPLRGAHSIWEITLHIAAWLGAIRTRLVTRRAELPAEGDWPEIGTASEDSWTNVRDLLEERHRGLLHDLDAMDDARLDDRIGRLRDTPTGAGVSIYTTLHGIIDHNIYHAGQIAILKKALRTP
jgi:uncharacterized damage-inducible protein DinB